MISYVKGILTEIIEDTIIVETGGIGVEIHVPLTLIGSLPHIGDELKIYTYFKVAEDSMSLYGFENRRDLDMFGQLIAISGIGPKGALAILSTLSPDELRMAVLAGDVKAISAAQGIGAKTAQRVILELKDKISAEDLLGSAGYKNTASVNSNESTASSEAVEALIALGYTGSQALRAVREVEIDDSMDSEAVLKAALKYLV